MVSQPSSLSERHRFPGELISHAVWLDYRFLLSYRDVEELLAERGATVSHETICAVWAHQHRRRFGDVVALGHGRRARVVRTLGGPGQGEAGWSWRRSGAPTGRGCGRSPAPGPTTPRPIWPRPSGARQAGSRSGGAACGTLPPATPVRRRRRGRCVALRGAESEVREVGSRRELFVDDWLIDSLEGASLRLHPPQPREVALRLDAPWEGPTSHYAAVLHDGDAFRLYYRGGRNAGPPVTAVALSQD